jgi:hypothetical protein
MNKLNIKLVHLLCLHLLLLFLQLPIRQLIIDTTFIRDIIIIFVFLYLLFTTKNLSFNSTIRNLVLILLLFGVLITIFQIINGIDPIYCIVNYRNYFFPFILFFISNKIFLNDRNRKSFIIFLYFLFLFLLVDIWFEYFIFQTKLPKTILPWYSYQFQNSYRYTTSSNSNIDSVDPSQTPILGILGWPHATSATFLSLYLFILPFIIDIQKQNFFKLNRVKKFLLMIFSIGAIIILGVKMQIFILLFFLPFIVLLDWKLYFFKFVKYIPVSLFLLIITEPFWYNSIINRFNIAFVGNEASGSTFSLIFDFEIIKSVIQSIFSNNIFNLFFGGYNTSDFWFYYFLEIRIINYTFEFGLIWLLLFTFIISYSVSYSYKKYKKTIIPIDKYIFLGFILFIMSFVFDSFHYFRLMNWPNIDILAILLGIVYKKDNYKSYT